MNFENSTFLALLILLPLFLVFFFWRGMARAAALRRIGETELVQALLSQISPLRRRLKAFFWLLALAALILAIARPTWGIENELVRNEGLQIVVAMDVSRSMNASDISPSRLIRARLDTLDLLRALQGNDIALLVFAREAFIYMPLTFDIDAVEIFLDGISSDSLTRQGTNIPAAIQTSMTAFEHRSQAQKIIILISDGENFEDDAITAAQIAAEENVIIYTIGYGTQAGSTIPVYDADGLLSDYQTNNGEIIVTTLNVDLLQRVAAETGGFYLQGGSDISPLVQDILSLQDGTLREEVISRPIERFGIFVAIALAFLSLEILLPETREEKS